MIVNLDKQVRHPEGKICLLKGAVLDCFPKEDSQGAAYPRSDRDAAWEELFLKEAFFLYEQREAVYADSRMFLTPLPFGNNLAYIGTPFLADATLGVYLEWWDSCERAVLRKRGEVSALTYFIAGSPLSGGNHCGAVTRKGRTRTVAFLRPFSEIWKSFAEVNQRYAEAKRLYQAYSLEETIALLRQA